MTISKTELERIKWRRGEKILFFGIGNIGRQDDGLGIRLIEKLEAAKLPESVSLDANYQLNAEDALLISAFDVVVFVDATLEAQAKVPFGVRPVDPSDEIAFTTHAMSVGTVVALCAELYGKVPRTYLMTLPGHEWDIHDGLTAGATFNLTQTFEALSRWLLG